MQLSAGSSDLAVAGEDLIGLLERSGTTLAQVARRLEEEFADRFSDVGVNPLAIIKRIRRLERDLPELKEQCQALITTKQELTDSARQLLHSNRDQLQALNARSGAPQHDDAAVVGAFDSAIGEWDSQMRRARENAGGGGLAYTTQALNLALARSNLQ
ncbi:hypothetical protein MNEG_8269 [Monoraphidium neglectum]|uniref:Protein FAM33A n=1 Tax=Monoraphidium neglectum TaxID=145388 RepID=A0A0D2N064_9CHLO|nr:hypothetical protein MNEG_8269 [Monoraphidium neglectum]KIY99690.1 hypothetical protein MNEG_8269 [Monoraphidium neglectum]|eukprot:XP_013898710.1 hypothetical protein MNEG_8269 [Monoraphidium neglectum]